MWNNIGRKLQGLAMVVCWLGIIASIIAAIVLWTQNSRYQSTILTGFLYLILGCLGSWIGSWAMYGLGLVVEYVENGGSRSGTASYYSDSSAASGHDVSTFPGHYWVCPNCKSRNPMSKIECKECGTVRK